jgi:hypothetical protein
MLSEKKRKLELLEKLNADFIKSLKGAIIPFFNNLRKIHLSNIDLNQSEKNRIMDCIKVTRYFSEKEASVENSIYEYLKTDKEKAIVEEINREIAKVKKIASDAQAGKYDALYSECENLLQELMILEANLEKLILQAA